MPSARDKSPMMAVDRKPDIECLVKTENGGFSGDKHRRMAAAVNPAPPPQLPSVQMFDTEVLYRRCGTLILFKTNSVLKLIEKWMNFSYSIHPIIANPELNKRCEALKSPLISWGSLKLQLNGILMDLAIGDLLSLYRPFMDESATRPDEKGFGLLNGKAQIGSTFETKFSVFMGKVFLSIDGVKALCHEKDETLLDVKTFLGQQEISEDDAYFKDDHGLLDRSKILLGFVFPLLDEESKVEAILRHVEKCIMEVIERKNSLVEEIEQTVEMINRNNITQQAFGTDISSDYQMRDVKPISLTHKSKSPKGGHQHNKSTPQGVISSNGIRRTYKECTNSQCGRTYHFIVSCCSLEHTMVLDKIIIPYMYHKGKIFLEKCSAFQAIGKTSVIRCSNYRKVDKILAEYDLNPSDEFLQQEKFATKRPRRRKLRHPEDSKIGRNRRNHVSLAALSVLIEANFVNSDRQTELAKDLHKFTEKLRNQRGHTCKFTMEDNEQGMNIDGQIEIEDDIIDLLSDEEDSLDGDIKIKSEMRRGIIGVRQLNVTPRMQEEDNKSSSGVESEDECILPDTPPQSNSPSPEPGKQPPRDRKPVVSSLTILNSEIQYKVLGDVLYLKKTGVFKLFHMKGVPRKMSEGLEKIIQESGFSMEQAFLYEGRLANYVSTLAIRHVLMHSDDLGPEVCKDIFLNELDRIESDIENLATIKYLKLKTIGTIKYQIQDDVVYFDTLRVLKLAGVQPTVIKTSPSKANAFVKKLLKDRGVNINACFLRQRQSKYAFINLRSALILLQYASENENKEKANKLKKEMLNAANEKNLLKQRTDRQATGQKLNYIKLGGQQPDDKERIESIRR